MRVLHVVPTYFPAVRYGGPIRSVHGLCAALSARGHDVHVFTTNVDGAGDSDVPLGEPVERDGVSVSYFPSSRLRRLYWSPPMARRLRDGVERFDLVHLHSVFLWPTWAAARAARRSGVPYVLSPRGMLVEDLLRARSRHVKAMWMALIERGNVRQAAGVHVTSSLERTEIERLGFHLSGRMFEVPNGVDVHEQLTDESSDAAPYVVILGRINWKKRIEIALEAVQQVDGVRLIVAGGDEDGLAATLRARAAALGMADRVELVGPVDGMRKRQLLHGAVALLMPSLSENFGNSALEAMAEGTPVVAAPQVGIADELHASGSGLVATDTAGFADAIRRLVGDPALRLQMGRRARATAADKYSWEAIGARMESEYRTVVREFARRPRG